MPDAWRGASARTTRYGYLSLPSATASNMSDDISKVLQNLTGDLPQPRLNLSESEKDALVMRLGPRTARNIVRAKGDYAIGRIPFLFSTLNTQDVVDLLANDVIAAIARVLPAAGKINGAKRK